MSRSAHQTKIGLYCTQNYLIKNSLLLVTLGISISSFAQLTLESSEMAPFGYTTQRRFLTATSFALVDTTLQGANQTWDFSDLTYNSAEAPLVLTILDPANTPYPNVVSTANYAIWEQPNNFYRFFELTPTYNQRVGSYTTSSYVFADPQVEYIYPLTYGTTNSDPWWGVNDGGFFKFDRSGYGTLVVPSATLEDVLMVRIRINGQFYTQFGYVWYDSNNGMILLQYFNGPIITSGLFYDAGPISVSENEGLSFTILENPVRDNLSFVLGQQTGNLDYTIYSSSGSVI